MCIKGEKGQEVRNWKERVKNISTVTPERVSHEVRVIKGRVVRSDRVVIESIISVRGVGLNSGNTVLRSDGNLYTKESHRRDIKYE